jgi:hypothetical protein
MRAPVLGEHTSEILSAWLGLDPGEIRALHERGIVESAQRQRAASAQMDG